MESEKSNTEPDPNPFPKMDLLPGIGWVKRLGGKMIRFAYLFPEEAPDFMSTHFKGGGIAFEAALCDTEHAVGHMVAVGEISAQEGLDWLERINWIENATLLHE